MDPITAYKAMDNTEREILIAWINNFVNPDLLARKRCYRLMEQYRDQMDGIVTEDEFKGAMLAAGFSILNPTENNWRFHR